MSKSNPFKWRHYEPEIILLCVRWYSSYPLSYRQVAEMVRRVRTGSRKAIGKQLAGERAGLGYPLHRIRKTLSTTSALYQRFMAGGRNLHRSLGEAEVFV